ncbi:unnamed protein product [Dicrocoelium dendriticum]|nr:unnamed protein product [Dicrocoelium dendriticum]
MPKTKVIRLGEALNVDSPDPIKHCLLLNDDEFDWDLITLCVAFIYIILGICCCLIQMVSIVQSNVVQCYGVGLWCCSSFIVAAVLAISLYMEERVPPVTLMLISIICDLFFGAAISITGSVIAGRCLITHPTFLITLLCCVLGVLVALAHAWLFIREVLKLRFQLLRRNSSETGGGL